MMDEKQPPKRKKDRDRYSKTVLRKNGNKGDLFTCFFAWVFVINKPHFFLLFDSSDT